MRKAFYFLAFLMLLPMSFGQVSNPSIIVVASAPSGACTQNLPDQQVIATGALYSCQNGTWAEISGGGGGSLPTATAPGQIITSTAAGTTYAAQPTDVYWNTGDTVASINANTLCSTACVYHLTGSVAVTASASLNAHVAVVASGGGTFNVSSGQTLTLGGKFSSPDVKQHFSGSGAVTLSATNNLVPVEWFGAIGDGSTNNLATIQAAINALTYGQVELQAGSTYNIAGTLTYTKNNTGMTCSANIGRGGSTNTTPYFTSCALVETTAGDDAIDVHGTSGTPIIYGTFNNFTIRSSVTQTGTAAGLSLSFTGGVKVENMLSQDFFYPYYIHASPSYSAGGFYHASFDWTSLSSGLTTPIGFYLDSSDGIPESSLTIRDSGGSQGAGPNSCIGMMLIGTAVNDVNTYNYSQFGCNDGQDVDYTGTGATASASDIHFISTTIDSYHQHGMFFTATSTADAQSAGSSITVVDPRISTAGATDGINITNTSGVIVSAGQFLNYGILASGSTQLTLTGNTIQNAASQTPIGLTSTTYSSVSSNTVTNASGAPGTWGIYLGGTSSFDNVTSNNVTGYFNYYDIYTDTSTSNNTVVGNQADPTHAGTAAIGTNGTGNIVFNTNPNDFRSRIDTSLDSGLDSAAYLGVGLRNFEGWNNTTVTRAWDLGYMVPDVGTAGNNPIFAYYNGSAWGEAWDINSANGILDAINGIVTPSVNQTAASSTGGTCAMAGTTSCTITLGHTYTTPVCIVTQQSATLTGGAGGCTVSGTTVTITAATLNSETWGAFVFGNPN